MAEKTGEEGSKGHSTVCISSCYNLTYLVEGFGGVGIVPRVCALLTSSYWAVARPDRDVFSTSATSTSHHLHSSSSPLPCFCARTIERRRASHLQFLPSPGPRKLIIGTYVRVRHHLFLLSVHQLLGPERGQSLMHSAGIHVHEVVRSRIT